MVILTLLAFSSNSVLVHYDAGGILSRSRIEGAGDTVMHGRAARLYCESGMLLGPLLQGGEARLGPWGAPGARGST